MKRLLCILLVMGMPALAYGQNTELGLRTLFMNQKCSWKEISLIDKGMDKRVSILGLFGSVRTNQGASIFYEGFFNTTTNSPVALDQSSVFNDFTVSSKDKNPTVAFELANSFVYNAIGMEYTLAPTVRPIVKVEQTKYSLSLVNPPQRTDISYNQYNLGVGLNIVQYSRTVLLQIKPVFLVGKNTSGWDIDINGRGYTRDLSAFIGVGYRYKDYTTGDLNYGISGPYLELGVTY